MACLLRCLMVYSTGGTEMSTFADPDLQARILREIRELYERQAKLEADIRAIDIAIHLRMEEDASFDIDAYRAVNLRRQTL
jgi:hypothetical protein